MNIFIKYENKKILLKINKYESINSIINKCLIRFNLDNNINNFFLELNGSYLNKDFSLEKYNIDPKINILTLNKKLKGGSGFISFATKNPATVALCFLIALLPIFILPLGFIPSIASLIHVIITKGFESIGKYLVCVLGKVTLFKRVKLIISIIKYIIFILMIFVIITLPLIILCITLKGHSLSDDPKSMCGAISMGNTAGLILTLVYVGIYLCFRCGNLVLTPIINLFKKVYILDTLFNPILTAALQLYNSSKYILVNIIPFVGQGITAYLAFLSAVMPALDILFSAITEIGCKTSFTKEAFMKKIMQKINNKKNNEQSDKQSNEQSDKQSDKFNDADEMCKDDIIKCCDPKNFINIADTLSMMITTSATSKILKSTGVFPSFILFVEALYESALLTMSNSADNLSGNTEDKKFYLRKVLQEKMNILTNNTKKLINIFLESGNDELIPEIKSGLFKNMPGNDTQINDIKYKLYEIEQSMIQFANENNSKYVPGKSLFKSIFKIVAVDMFCNISSTSKAGQSVIVQMGSMGEVVDMLKAGSTSGFFTSIIYLITFIILLICGIFNIF